MHLKLPVYLHNLEDMECGDDVVRDDVHLGLFCSEIVGQVHSNGQTYGNGPMHYKRKKI